MLQVQNICKSYTTGDFTQTALDNVSISFRDNEFVAILGPSGSGKTTLLNIIGGLDHYDSGNMIIDGVPTDQYKDRDWDTYRNNRIGFVFQSYNLIPHQTILANVELALTLSGVSREERHNRAVEALKQVGLGDHINKKPSQLSGGQMQRVAIARALINDPEILLADEPTGALDSKTSVQVMDLLTEIARDRLVIMVTHNPELAQQYATRIVNLSDGVIRSDTDPFDPTPDEMRLSGKQIRRTSMSFLTALSLSFNNLMTKKGRTFMTAFAGSIGIIGIAAILSLANGVNDYIKSIEEETLSEYPLQITSSGFDMTSMLVGAEGMEDSDESAEGTAEEGNAEGADDATEDGSSSDSANSETGLSITVAGKDVVGNSGSSSDGAAEQVHVVPMISGMFSSIGQNDLASLKEYLDSGESGIEPYVKTIEYTYDVTPQIFSSDTENLRQVNPDTSMSALGLGSTNSTNSLMSMSMSTDVFYEMPEDPSLYETQYDVVAGRWPESYNECILVTTSGGSMSDFMLYTLGLRDSAELDDMVEKFAAEEEVSMPAGIRDYSYDEILGITFKLVNAYEFYSYDASHGVWVDKQDNESYMRDLVANGEDITIVGIVQPREDATASMLMAGINYPTSLTEHIIEQAAGSQIVQDQLADPDINVFTGKPFGEDDEEGLGLDSLFSIDTGAIESAFSFDTEALAAGMNNLNFEIDEGSLPEMPDLGTFDPSTMLPGGSTGEGEGGEDAGSGESADATTGGITPEQAEQMATEIMQGYMQWCAGDYSKTFAEFLSSEAGQAVLAQALSGVIGSSSQQMMEAYSAYLEQALGSYVQQLTAAIEAQVSAQMQLAMAQLMANMASAMNVDANAFANAFQFNMTEEDLSELIMAMMTSSQNTYDNNLSKLGYADYAEPSGINIYPIDFESKERVIEILDAYNDRMEDAGEDDKVISYTDYVGALMSSVTDIVNMISYVLIAFVAISLIVSSIMIGVITYISVLERKKEIGILRAIGASKKDIGHIFNAETVIEGLVSGLLGVGITALMCIPASAIINSMFDVANIAKLPLDAAVVLVIISVVLSFIAGVIPSRSASKKDPVEALRSE